MYVCIYIYTKYVNIIYIYIYWPPEPRWFPLKIAASPTENSTFQRLHWRPRKGWMIPSWQPPESLRKHSSEFLLNFLELLETGQVPQAQEDYDAWVGTTLWILVDGYWRLKNGEWFNGPAALVI